ncbi:alpha/beta-hydrolase [Mytilinidion resinicola]|uniref:Alpha/beta-hydrolase n=1 Tax=Mytilinidion resinicola TaxID=574789 RepID=A0A6A6YW37_9PEZI|nr:alpha/beta-hydrolase [Mytilinidion resinicola]KAF2813021.1 alpha/beta-hydrolase [Mytilinidion resinicola]
MSFVGDTKDTNEATKIYDPLDPTVLRLLDPEFVEYYNSVLGTKIATHHIPLSEVRANPEKWSGSWCKDYTGSPGVKNFTIPSDDGYQVKCRSYNPDPARHGEGPFPVHINFHGGGFVFGDLTADAEFCMMLKDRLGIIVIDVDYRLCPEHRFGKNIGDSWAALKWVHEHASETNGLPDSISIGGISAGGQIACVLQHMARDARVPLKFAILSVPTTDFHTYFPTPDHHAPFHPLPSVARFAKAPSLPASRLAFFKSHVFPDEHRDFIEKEVPLMWRAPLHAPNFKELCDAFVITAECDPLVDEGEAYGRKMVEAGGMVIFKRYLGVPHPFMHMTKALAKARQYENDVCAALKMAHGL